MAVVLELYSRRVIGLVIAERIDDIASRKASLLILIEAVSICSVPYQRLIDKHHLICSMSKKSDCYDNAAMESWIQSYKVEAVHGERFLTRADARYYVFEYIEVYYHRKRIRSKLGYLSPERLRPKWSLSKVSRKSGQDQYSLSTKIVPIRHHVHF